MPGERPLRCVRLWTGFHDCYDEQTFSRWLAAMQARYRLAAAEQHVFPIHYKDRDLECIHRLEVYEFVAQSAGAPVRIGHARPADAATR